MIINELDLSAEYRLSRILALLESLYNITLDFSTARTRADLVSVFEKYENVRNRIIREAQHNTYNQDPEYAKACLIQEAVFIFLSEIAPKRLNHRQARSRFKEQN
jgi:hypothetical protein